MAKLHENASKKHQNSCNFAMRLQNCMNLGNECAY